MHQMPYSPSPLLHGLHLYMAPPGYGAKCQQPWPCHAFSHAMECMDVPADGQHAGAARFRCVEWQ